MNNATIEYDENILNIEKIGELIKKGGFESLGIEDFRRENKKEINYIKE